ncbi:MAG: tryptophan 2,3-dioxygenase [Candidatus Electrothrix sp. AUS4]|nr:tryptophan 2,3-dioxygenase [Candidatus Electrothrix sp. AUS4]
MALTYASYLQVENLLLLQKPESDKPEHDEMLFIIIHQAYELWFKEVLHEIDHLTDLMFACDRKKIPHTIKRIRTIFKVLVHQTDILKTMTPMEFLSFRNTLQTASGFQSSQFRELEFALGYKRTKIQEIFNKSPSEHERLLRRIARPSVWDGFLALLHAAGYPVPKERLEKISDEPTVPSKEIQQILRETYNSDPQLSYICEGLLDIDEVIQEWRYQHVKTVERILGDKPGTGGSSGAEYLRGTLFKPFFPDLWAIRSDIAA